MLRTIVLAAGIAAIAVIGTSTASELVYKPVNPNFGGDPLNGNALLSQATAQSAGGGSPGFSIDFPDFGGIPQPVPDPTDLPPVGTPN
ncbi:MULTISPECIES: curli assembly protein CsgF [unclassified Mesorhizobium]|uniref:curli assembly protein CsgF n=1 Tax=unclassified Mesorhizobium TaxID=325217 RepID=UPI00112CB275|nr:MULTISPECIES: curli assembly protein CsgF [unclassified Mesorhizobium]MBZ9701735.1 curli assembly protein CsgF [Mesorhizobium sp. CO1-1-3]MBZ9949083.1 curli assembly protein CsgF [Mesorhizobium sp. BR1-1-11]TPI99706.1 curli assembly protein CsgF [Mesorhizobium sp. B2-8-1]